MDKWEGSQLNQAKEILAFELTKLVHGEEEAAKGTGGRKSAVFSWRKHHQYAYQRADGRGF